MGIKQTLSDNPMLGYGLVVVILLVAAGLVTLNLLGGEDAGASYAEEAPDSVWFYDIGSGELFAAPGDNPGPITAPSGATLEDGRPGGVLAMVLSCGACTTEETFISYVEVLDPIEAEKPYGLRNSSNSFVAAPVEGGGELEWHYVSSTEGAAIVGAARAKCGGPAKKCLPMAK